jgi:hypothetical protein
MIKLKQPALALHSHDVPGYRCKMQTTWLMPAGATVNNVVYWIDWAIRNSANQRLENVVINCHGTPGFLHVGGSWNGFGIEGVKSFEKFKGKNAIGTIWILACNVAGGDGIGMKFCTALSKAADCKVIAAMGAQSVEKMFDYFRPNECIDDFEGMAWYFKGGESGSFSNTFGREY